MSKQEPHELIEPLWHGSSSVTLRTNDVQRVFLHYGADFLHMRAGRGYTLKSKRVGPGLYKLCLERA